MSVFDDYEWPDSFPKNVTTEEGKPASGHVYRAVKKIPPDENDFQTTREEYPRREFMTKEEKQRSHGVSFFEKIDVLRDKVRRYNSLKGCTIVHGDLINSLGVVSKSNRHGHVTLWKCVDSKPHKYINVPVGESS